MRAAGAVTGMQVERIAGALGAEIRGLNLALPLDEEQQADLRRHLAEHLVLVFRNQSLTPPTQIAFTRIFGPVEPHPLPTHRDPAHPELLVLPNRPGNPGRRNDFWHTDMTFAECPPAASVLHALEVPENRGDTLFCNMIAAHDNLSETMRDKLRAMRAMHSAEPEVKARASATPDAAPDAAPDGTVAARTPEAVCHPVVWRHPETGRACLFVNPYFTQRFADMTVAESRPLIRFLARHATRPENVYRHRWRVGDVVVWDNRATMHYAVHDYDETMPRLLHRTTAAGSRPV